jgi:AraC-like DNA-binding protein
MSVGRKENISEFLGMEYMQLLRRNKNSDNSVFLLNVSAHRNRAMLARDKNANNKRSRLKFQNLNSPLNVIKFLETIYLQNRSFVRYLQKNIAEMAWRVQYTSLPILNSSIHTWVPKHKDAADILLEQLSSKVEDIIS